MAVRDGKNEHVNNTPGYSIIAVFVIVIAALVFVTLKFRKRFELILVALRTRSQRERSGAQNVESVQRPRTRISPHLLQFIPIRVYQATEQIKTQPREVHDGSTANIELRNTVPSFAEGPPLAIMDASKNNEKQVLDDVQFPACCICIDDILEGQRVRVLPCEHLYHVACVDDWISTYSETCPIWYLQAFHILEAFLTCR